MSDSASDCAQQSAWVTARLSGGDRRSTGAAEVAREVIADLALTAVLVTLMGHADPGVDMRAAVALQKASRQRPDLLSSQTAALLHDIGRRDRQELRWHGSGPSAISYRQS